MMSAHGTARPNVNVRRSVRITMFFKQVRNIQLCSLVFLLLPWESLTMPQVAEIFPMNLWTAECWKKTNCAGRPSPDNELSASRFLLNFSCHCDTACERFGDCCLDSVHDPCAWNQTCGDQFQIPKPQEYYSCKNVPEVDPYGGIYLVSKCPEGWTDEFVRNHCEENFENDTLLNLPVVGKRGADNYKNLYCAICHGQDKYLYWSVETCCKNTTIEEVDERGSSEVRTQVCQTEYRSPESNYTYRPCRKSIATCPIDFQDVNIRELCVNGSAVYMYSDTNTYKNIYCAVCNNVSLDEVYCTKQDVGHHDSLCHAKKRKLPYSFKILLDMNKNSRTKSTRVGMRGIQISTRNITRNLRCPTNRVYDPFIRACRAIWCPISGEENWSDCRPQTGDELGDNVDNGVSLDCPWVRLNQTEYQLDVNGTIFISSHQKRYQPAEFRLSGGYAFVCAEFTQNYTEHKLVNGTKIAFNFSETQVYLSLVGVLLSLIALAVQMLVYALLPTLRNVPGKNLMCLVASLFLAELLFLVAPSLEEVSKEACVAIAIMMHCGFQAAFCWMQVMAFDIWYTFSRKSLHSPQNGKSSAFWFYQAYGWLTPIVIVSVAVIVDNFTEPDFFLRPLYGQGICWIASRAGLIMFFAGPVAIVVFSNIIFFILTIRSIIEVDKSTSIAHKNSEKRRFFLYVKLCFLMGVAWAFGFLAAFTDVQALWYLFVILNTLQGMFICVAFVCTKKVLKLLKEKFHCEYRAVSLGKSRGTVSSSTGKTTLSTKSTYAVLGKNVQEV
ncbi:uncharacterized protein LOC135462220 [Liolophura sinensis]|uniref:uncharacterized protein LOC135462220 n=1 Tax=Liolophura sinensis TaxID=3198878 RepID=UPI0031596427